MDSVIPRLEKFANKGLFGEISKVRVGPSSNNEKSAQFQSQLGFFEVDLVTKEGKVRQVPVVAKVQLDTVSPETKHFLSEQFANEVTAYQKVLPDLGAGELQLHPIMYYGFATKGKDPEQDLIVLEDLRHQGFKVPKDVFLDYDHINLALRKLGEFHGLSYKMKISSPDEFNELKNLLTRKHVWDSDGYIETSMLRGFKTDLESSPGNSVLNQAHEKLSSKNSKELIEQLSLPEEPFAVLVHGDFLKNNVLFKYDEHGKPCEIRFFDFATAMYSDPTIDLSLFLYMHTSHGREERWNDHLASYWDGILSIGNPGFTFQEFMDNFAKKAVYGFMISAFFLPLMQHPETLFPFDKGFPEKPKEEKMEVARNFGGEDSTAALRSIVRHLYHEGYLEAYLLRFEQCTTQTNFDRRDIMFTSNQSRFEHCKCDHNAKNNLHT